MSFIIAGSGPKHAGLYLDAQGDWGPEEQAATFESRQHANDFRNWVHNSVGTPYAKRSRIESRSVSGR